MKIVHISEIKKAELEVLAHTLYDKSQTEIYKFLIDYEKTNTNVGNIIGYTIRFDLHDFEILWILQGLEKIKDELDLPECIYEGGEGYSEYEFDNLVDRLKYAHKIEYLDLTRSRKKEIEEDIRKLQNELEEINQEIVDLESNI